MAITIQIDGMEKAVEKLQQLRQIDRKSYRQIKTRIKKAAKPMETAMKQAIQNGRNRKDVSRFLRKGKDKSTGLNKFINVTYRPGNLKRSIDTIMTTRGRSLVVNVGARFGRKAKANADGYYAAMVAYGTERGGKRGLEKAKGNKRYKRYDTATLKDTRNKNYQDRGFDMGKEQTIAALTKEVKYILETSITKLGL
jgi:hypothetical protein